MAPDDGSGLQYSIGARPGPTPKRLVKASPVDLCRATRKSLPDVRTADQTHVL